MEQRDKRMDALGPPVTRVEKTLSQQLEPHRAPQGFPLRQGPSDAQPQKSSTTPETSPPCLAVSWKGDTCTCKSQELLLPEQL